MAIVTLNQVCKQFKGGTALAVDHVDLTIADGEFMVLLGPSGCGKSTTLRMIAGLETITSGTLSIDGVMVNDQPAKDRDIAMVFQSYALYPHMSVEDNLAFGLRRRKIDRAEIARRVAEVANTLGLSELLARKPFALSGGQRQRVALGRAIVREPKVFLFDEPLSNLDAALRVSTRLELAKLHHRLDATMIYVTHDQVEAMTLGDRICVMHEGRVAQVGSPLDVYRHPASVFVARFLGSPPMNILPARLDLANGRPTAVTNGGRLNLTAFAAEALGPSQSDILIGIRPEDIALEGVEEAPLSATVQAVELLGAETIVALDTTTLGGDLLVRAGRDAKVKVGDRVGLRPTPAELHMFDAKTGAAVARTAVI